MLLMIITEVSMTVFIIYAVAHLAWHEVDFDRASTKVFEKILLLYFLLCLKRESNCRLKEDYADLLLPDSFEALSTTTCFWVVANADASSLTEATFRSPHARCKERCWHNDFQGSKILRCGDLEGFVGGDCRW